jgi:hypothetical protein
MIDFLPPNTSAGRSISGQLRWQRQYFECAQPVFRSAFHDSFVGRRYTVFQRCRGPFECEINVLVQEPTELSIQRARHTDAVETNTAKQGPAKVIDRMEVLKHHGY